MMPNLQTPVGNQSRIFVKTRLICPLPLLAGAWLAGVPLHTAGAAQTPKAGDAAPLVQGTDQDGNTWKLADVVSKKAVRLYFYPKDDTPGCTTEACGLRDRMADLKKDKVEVIGGSFESTDSHQKFIAKYNLNFPRLADTDDKIADAYGVLITGRDMVRRVSFLIGLNGKIAHVTDTPSADTHLSEMKEAVDERSGQ